jgi:hypothetical protein
MSGELFSLEQFLHLFPALFAILLCFLSKIDHLWIDAKLQNELARGKSPNLALIASTKLIANGAAALNIHIINVLLFFAGAIFAVFDWPPCQLVWPLTICVILFVFILYDVLITSVHTPFEAFDRTPNPPDTSSFRLWRWMRNRHPSVRLRWEQIAFNLIIIGLVIGGAQLGGAKDARGLCKIENPATTPDRSPPPHAQR